MRNLDDAVVVRDDVLHVVVVGGDDEDDDAVAVESRRCEAACHPTELQSGMESMRPLSCPCCRCLGRVVVDQYDQYVVVYDGGGYGGVVVVAAADDGPVVVVAVVVGNGRKDEAPNVG